MTSLKLEADPYEHDGIDGWHHHHGPFDAVTFHKQGRWEQTGDEYAYSVHFAAHDEYQGEVTPCRDSDCVWLLPFGVRE